MKYLLLLTALTFNTVSAQEISFCEEVEGTARTIMKLRQEGRQLSVLMKQLDYSEFAKKMLIAAYSKPKFDTDEYKNRAINGFADEVYLQCVKKRGA